MGELMRFRSWSRIFSILLSVICLFSPTQSFTIRNIVGKQIVVLGKHLYTKLQEPMSNAQKYISTGMVAITANLSFDGIKSAMINQKNTIQSQKVALKTKMSNLKQNIIYQHRNRHSSTSFIREAVRNVGPSVVRIDCDCESDIPLNIIGSSTGYSQKDDKVRRVSGSGFVISEDGYIMTNAHVVEKAKSILITLPNGRTFKANLIACDELTDLAVLKIDCRGNNIKLKKAPLGDSSKLQAGDWLIAVGCPAGLDFTVTLGIVSSPKRSAYEVGAPHLKGTFIQTDTLLHKGNSGGPLVNDYGEVVGINTMIQVDSQTVGFAIPINRAFEIFNILKEGRKPTHAYFGLELTNITPDIARIINETPNTPKLPNNIKGAVIVGIAPSSPAAETANFKEMDVIIEINGVIIKDMNEAEFQLDKSPVGEYCHMKVMRGDSNIPIDIYVIPQDLLKLLQEQQKLKTIEQQGEKAYRRDNNREDHGNTNDDDDEEEEEDTFIDPSITDLSKANHHHHHNKGENSNNSNDNNSNNNNRGKSEDENDGSSGAVTNSEPSKQGLSKVPPSPSKWRKQTFKLWNHQR